MNTKKLKIGFDAKRLFHNFTGLGNYSRTLVRELQARYPEHEYHLFVNKASEHLEVQTFLDAGKFQIHTSNSRFGGYWRSYACTSDFDRLGLDIYHGLSHELPFNIKKSKVKSVISFHDLIYEKYPSQFGFIDSSLYKYKYRKSTQLADIVVAISQSTKNDLIDLYGLNPQKTEVIYQGQSVTIAQPNAAKATISLPPNYWLYVGSIIERKRLEDIILAISSMPLKEQKPLVVVGTGKEYAQKVRSLIQDKGMDDQVIFTGQVSNTQLGHIYRHATALLFPSMYEGFGIPLIESIASGTPVIAAKVSSLPEAAGPGGLYFEAKNHQELMQCMQTLQSSKELRQKLVKEGQAYVSANFDHPIICKKWMELYQSLAHR